MKVKSTYLSNFNFKSCSALAILEMASKNGLVIKKRVYNFICLKILKIVLYPINFYIMT